MLSPALASQGPNAANTVIRTSSFPAHRAYQGIEPQHLTSKPKEMEFDFLHCRGRALIFRETVRMICVCVCV